jgi:hypothetical protein
VDELVVVEPCPSGQFAACGPWPPLFAQVVVVVVVVVVDFFNPPFTGEVLVVESVVVVVLGGLAKATVAKEGDTISVSAAATTPITTKLVLACVISFTK